jgi:hypothetical protein
MFSVAIAILLALSGQEPATAGARDPLAATPQPPAVARPTSATQPPGAGQAPEIARIEVTNIIPIVSVENVRDRLDRPARKLSYKEPVGTVTYHVEVRSYFKPMPTFEEHLASLFAMNELQRQSADWASRGSGINLMALAKGVKNAWREHQTAVIRSDIQRELYQLQQAADSAKPATPIR